MLNSKRLVQVAMRRVYVGTRPAFFAARGRRATQSVARAAILRGMQLASPLVAAGGAMMYVARCAVSALEYQTVPLSAIVPCGTKGTSSSAQGWR